MLASIRSIRDRMITTKLSLNLHLVFRLIELGWLLQFGDKLIAFV